MESSDSEVVARGGLAHLADRPVRIAAETRPARPKAAGPIARVVLGAHERMRQLLSTRF
jgi:hypothetical protein